MKVDSPGEEDHLFEEDRLSKAKAVLLSTMEFDSTGGHIKVQQDHSLEKRYLRDLTMTALTPECSKAAGDQRTRKAAPN